jgi:hypothetical protein
MSGNTQLSADGTTLAVRVPMTVARRGGRKVIVAPDEGGLPQSRSQVDNTLVKALARAFRWRKLIETGVYGTIAELASAEKVNPSYVSRTLRLTLLAPEVVESALDHRLPHPLSIASVIRPLPTQWDLQRSRFFE